MKIHFHQRLKELREEKRYSQETMADKFNISRKTYRGYEDGTVYPRIDFIYSLCDYFNVSADYLLGKSETKTVAYSGIAETTGLSEMTINYLSDINEVSNVHKETALKKQVINAILEDAKSLDILKKDIEKEKNLYWPQSEFSKYKPLCYPVLDEIEHIWYRNDYAKTPEGQEELNKQAEEYYAIMRELEANDPEPHKMSEEAKFYYNYKMADKDKSHLIDVIVSYILFNPSNVYLTGINCSTKLTNGHEIVLEFGDKRLCFPSSESNDLIDYTLIQNVIYALKEFKKKYHKNK